MLGITALKDYRHVDDFQDILRSVIGDGSSPGRPVKPHVQTCLFRRAAAKGKPFGGTLIDPDLVRKRTVHRGVVAKMLPLHHELYDKKKASAVQTLWIHILQRSKTL